MPSAEQIRIARFGVLPRGVNLNPGDAELQKRFNRLQWAEQAWQLRDKYNQALNTIDSEIIELEAIDAGVKAFKEDVWTLARKVLIVLLEIDRPIAQMQCEMTQFCRHPRLFTTTGVYVSEVEIQELTYERSIQLVSEALAQRYAVRRGVIKDAIALGDFAGTIYNVQFQEFILVGTRDISATSGALNRVAGMLDLVRDYWDVRNQIASATSRLAETNARLKKQAPEKKLFQDKVKPKGFLNFIFSLFGA